MTKTAPSLASRAIGILVAPDATRSEWILSLSAAVLGSALAATHAARAHAIGSWRLALVALVAFDMFGGAVANCTDSCKRFWHPPERTRGAAFGMPIEASSAATFFSRVAAAARLRREISAAFSHS